MTIATVILLAVGWQLSLREEFIPAEGAGYWLGIAGGGVLLSQLLYPLRKRARFMKRLGTMRHWFQVHVLFGIIGPLLILYHANFSLGAVNSNVALFAMLTVAASGIAGRYFYGRIHNRVNGAHSQLQDLLAEATELLRVVETDAGGSGGRLAGELTAYGLSVLKPRQRLLPALARALWLAMTAPAVRMRLAASARRVVDANAPRLGWSDQDRRDHRRATVQHIDAFVDAVNRASQLAFYDRVFALWHVLHLPLFILLVVTGIVHVIAVHLY